MTLPKRVLAAQATKDNWTGVAFQWGRHDCAKLVAWHLRVMGHEVRLAKAGSYRTAIGARRALRNMGFASLSDALDSRFERWPAPAFALPGDIVIGEGDDAAFEAMGVWLGNGALLGFHERTGAAGVLRGKALAAAWRVDPA